MFPLVTPPTGLWLSTQSAIGSKHILTITCVFRVRLECSPASKDTPYVSAYLLMKHIFSRFAGPTTSMQTEEPAFAVAEKNLDKSPEGLKAYYHQRELHNKLQIGKTNVVLCQPTGEVGSKTEKLACRCSVSLITTTTMYVTTIKMMWLLPPPPPPPLTLGLTTISNSGYLLNKQPGLQMTNSCRHARKFSPDQYA